MRLSLTTIRLNLWLPLLVAAATASMVGFNLVYSYRHLLSDIETRGMHKVREEIAELNSAFIHKSAEEHRRHAYEQFAFRATDPNIRILALIDPQRKILYGNHLAWLNQPLSSHAPGLVNRHLNGALTQGRDWIGMADPSHSRIEAYFPISLGRTPGSSRPDIRGAIVMVYDLAREKDRTLALVLRQQATTSVMGILMAGLLVLGLRRYVTYPANTLLQATHRVAGGELETRIEVEGSGELADLARDFNHMAATLNRTVSALRQSEQYLNTTLLSIGDAVIVTDAEARVERMNRVAESLTGWPLQEARGRPLNEVFHLTGGEDDHTLANPLERVFRQGTVRGLTAETILISRDGSPHRTAVSAAPIHEPETRRFRGAVMVFRDVSEESRLRERLRDQNDRLEAITQALPDAGFVLDEDGRYLEVFGGREDLLYDRAEMLVGKRVRDVLPRAVATRIADTIDATLKTGTPQVLEFDLDVPAGLRHFEGRAAPIAHTLGGHKAVAWLSRDISDRKIAEQRAERLAYYDGLTGLPNRVATLHILEKELARCRRYHEYSALLFLDLDHFKDINDSLGHPTGDDLLVEVSRRLLELLREEDTAGRLGGDEFLVLLTRLSEHRERAAHGAEKVAIKIQDAFQAGFEVSGHRLHLTPSIGVSIFPVHEAEQASDILRQADTAMYRAKKEGRNRICFFTESDQAKADRRFWTQHTLKHAVENQEMELWFQPVVDETGRCLGAEALIRWRHPERGLLTPNDFIGVAEDSGLILGIGDWVVNEGCRLARRWQQDSTIANPCSLALNLSPAQLQHPNFVNRTLEICEQYGTDLGQLRFELTEQMLVTRFEATRQKMEALAEHGAHFYLDDFGTGYAALRYLQKLPLEGLKIDRGFVQDLERDPNDATLVRAITDLARNLGLRVVAEGVETGAQLAFLINLGVSCFQGFYFHRPLPLRDYEHILRGNHVASQSTSTHRSTGR